MVIERGQIWWADLPEPRGSGPGYEHPVVIIQSDNFNQTKLNTVIGAVITSNLNLAEMPGNTLLLKNQSELPKDSVVNVTQIVRLIKRICSNMSQLFLSAKWNKSKKVCDSFFHYESF